MTDVAVVERQDMHSDAPLAIWADSARRAASVAVSLAKTPFVPQSLRGVRTSTDQTQSDLDQITAANVTAAILTGQEIGIQPMAALRSIDVIQGVPAMRAIALRALVQSKGHELWVAEQSATRAIVRGKRYGSAKEQESIWTMDRARALGLVGKDNWRKQPMAMLVARATSELCRLIAADVILGIPYSVEELQDGDDVEAEVLVEAKPAKRTAQRKVNHEVAPEPPEPEFPVEDLPVVVSEGGQEWAEPPLDFEPTVSTE